MLREIVERAGHPRKVNKVVCFGLGDFSTKPPDWRSPGKNSQLEGNRELETSVIEESLIRHAVAVTLAQVARSYADIGGTDLRLVTQDPQYTIETEDILQELGYEIVGAYGAEGFAEVDDTSIVFAPYTSAPVTQIIADLARPAVIICNHSIEILSSFK